MTLISSYGGPTSNSYIDVTQANSYIRSATLNPAPWNALSGAQKQAALQQATRDIDAFTYVGHRYFYDQLLKFPRQYRSTFPFNRTSSQTLGQDVTQVRMRSNIQQATALQALKIATDGGTSEAARLQAEGITGFSKAVGPIRESVQFGKGGASKSIRSRMDPQAFSLLQEWLTTRNVYRR